MNKSASTAPFPYDYKNCRLCPRQCRADRTQLSGQKQEGFCQSRTQAKIARAALHHWEEPCISGIHGSGTVFFSGCTLGCCFCQNHVISHQRFGKEVTVRQLSAIFLRLQAQNAHNINLVSPTPFVPAILEALEEPPPVPVVWNTGGYERVETLRMLEGKVQIWLPDMKYADRALADYIQVIQASAAKRLGLTEADPLQAAVEKFKGDKKKKGNGGKQS